MDDGGKLGERNNNPLNLEGRNIPWHGLLGCDPKGYCIFATVELGLRAGARDLHTKWAKDGLRTFAAIVPKFAPAADHNDVAAYVADLVSRTGIGADEPLDLDSAAELASVVKAFICHENGRCIYSDETIIDACRIALIPD